jgi:quercetin dioxygenase-like cupin family protein
VVASITFSPGRSTGWPTHPGVVLVTVASGRVQEIDADCDPEVFTAGESFVEEGDVHLARNRGSVDAVVYVTWIIPTWTPADALSVPADAPEGCNAR